MSENTNFEENLTFEEKLIKYFDNSAVNKDKMLKVFNDLNLPSYIRDWFLKEYSDKHGKINNNYLQQKINEILPRKETWNLILEELINQRKTIKILAKINVFANLKSGEYSFELPDFGVLESQTYIVKDVINNHKKILLSGAQDIWGVLTLSYQDMGEKKPDYKIVLDDFVNFRPYTADLNYFIKAREKFTLEEWLDILLGAIDYNPNGYSNLDEKLMILKRLFIFVEKRLNLIELAPKGTGKSYVFSQISKFGWLNSGGIMTRAKMFYDMSRKQHGLIANYDFVALDEISTIKFSNEAEMQSALKGYLENGRYTVGRQYGTANAGVVLLGNIPKDKMDINTNFISSLSNIFSDSAVLDRFHGFLEGWKISRMSENKKVSGWALNSEYFAEIMHLMRDDIRYITVVEKLLNVPSDADTRDITAIKRLTSAAIKVFFPNWIKPHLVDIELFEEYCLKPAIYMRSIIRKQLELIDNEYANKPMPIITINEI